MKKILCTLLVLSTIFSMSACTSTKEPETETEAETISNVEHVIYLINELSIYSYHPDDDVAEIEAAYNALSSEEKELITNYGEYQKKKLQIAHDRYEEELEDTFKNPASVQINSCFAFLYYAYDYKTPVYAKVSIDYSAQNSFGGYVRDTAYFGYEFDPEKGEWQYDGKLSIDQCLNIEKNKGVIQIIDSDELKP